MKKRLLSIALTLALCLGLLPGTAWAAEERETRTDPLVLTNQEDENTAQGWSWKLTNEGGYILTLDNVDFNVSSGYAVEFQLNKDIPIGTVTIQLIGDNHVVSADNSGFCADWNHRALHTLVITGDSLEVTAKWYGFFLDNDCNLELRDVTLIAKTTETMTDASGDAGAYGLSVKNGNILLDNSTVSTVRVRTGILTSRNSDLTATALDGGYSRDIIKTDEFTFSGGKLTVYGPEGLNNRAVYASAKYGGVPIGLSDCELDIHDVEQGMWAQACNIHLDNVTGTVSTTSSAPCVSASISAYNNAAFTGTGAGTCKNCQILALTGTGADDVPHTIIYGDYTVTEDTTWATQNLHLQENCTLTVAQGVKLTFPDEVKIDGNYESGRAELVNNGTLEFAESGSAINIRLTNNGTLAVSGYVSCDQNNFINQGTFNGSIGNRSGSVQYYFGNVTMPGIRVVGSTGYFCYAAHIMPDAVLTIPAGKTLNASGNSFLTLTPDILGDCLTVAETGKIVVEPEGQLLLPAGITQDQLDALRLSGGGTVMVGDEKANWVTFMEGEKTLLAKILIPDNKLDLTGLEKDGYLLQLYKDSGTGELFDPKDPITEDLTLYVQWLKILPDPPAAGEDGTQYRLVMEEGLSEVPEGLQNVEGLKTVEAIETKLTAELTGVPENNKAIYDVELMVKKGDGEWEKATADNFPSSGELTVTLPYPGETDETYKFTVVHMFTTNINGKTPGELEMPTVTNTAAGIQFQVTGLSPISVGWTEPSAPPAPPAPPTSSSSGSSSGTTYYTITASAGEGGKIDPSGKVSVRRGRDKVFTIIPGEGYTISDVLVDGVSVGAVSEYTFEKVTKRHTIAASFKQTDAVADCPKDTTCPACRFTDLDLGRWYHDGIHFCVEHGLMMGTSDTTFAPERNASRAMAVTILWRLQGAPVVNYAMRYDDVDQSAWYAEAVRWASSEGIVGGYGNGRFGPGAPITREQLAVMLYRFEQKYGGGGFTGSWMFLLDFNDREEISEWAYEAMCWMTMNKVMDGKGGKLLDPQGKATRAEAAAMLQRYIQTAEK